MWPERESGRIFENSGLAGASKIEFLVFAVAGPRSPPAAPAAHRHRTFSPPIRTNQTRCHARYNAPALTYIRTHHHPKYRDFHRAVRAATHARF